MLLEVFPIRLRIARLTVSSDTEFQQVILRFTVNAWEGVVVATDTVDIHTRDPMAAAIEALIKGSAGKAVRS